MPVSHIPVHPKKSFFYYFPQFFKVKFDMLASHIPVHLVLEAKVELLVAPAHSIFSLFILTFSETFPKTICFGTIN